MFPFFQRGLQHRQQWTGTVGNADTWFVLRVVILCRTVGVECARRTVADRRFEMREGGANVHRRK